MGGGGGRLAVDGRGGGRWRGWEAGVVKVGGAGGGGRWEGGRVGVREVGRWERRWEVGGWEGKSQDRMFMVSATTRPKPKPQTLNSNS